MESPDSLPKGRGTVSDYLKMAQGAIRSELKKRELILDQNAT